jgi:c-di-GMP-binding flagellar brake protein YcgR
VGDVVKRQRSCKRKPVAVACWVIANDEVVCYQTVDLSDTGICLTTRNPLEVGKIVEIQLFLPLSASPLSVTAEVVWSEEEGEGNMGLQFLERSEKVLTALRDLAHHCSRKPAS